MSMSRGLRVTKRFLFATLAIQLLCVSNTFSQSFFTAFWKKHIVVPFTWTGAGGDTNWNNVGNWTDGVAPGVGDTAHFTQYVCNPNCNATVNVNISVAGIDMQTGYAGAITQGSSTITIGSAGWMQAAGTFAGGSAALTMNGDFALSGGTFTSTSGVLNINANYVATGTSVFMHNSGTVTFVPTNTGTSFQTGIVSFNNVNFTGSNKNLNLAGSTITVLGALTMGDVTTAGVTMTGGTVLANGGVTVNNFGYTGTTLLKIAGVGSQTVTGVSTASFPDFEIASTGGTVTISGTLVMTGNYTYTAGTISATVMGTSYGVAVGQAPALYYKMDEISGTTAADASGNGVTGTLSGSYTLGQPGREGTDFQFGSNGIITLNSGIVLGASWTVSAWVKTPLANDGNWKTVTRGSNYHHIIFDSGTNEFGNYMNGFHGSGVLANSLTAGWHHFTAVGTGGNTLFYVDGGYVSTVPFQPTDTLQVVGNYQAGGQPVADIDDVAVYLRALNATEINSQANPPTGSSSTIVFKSNSGAPTITPGSSVNYGSVSIVGNNANYTISGTLNVAGTLTVGDPGVAGQTLSGGIISASGSVMFQDFGYGGTTQIKIAGNADQTVTGAAMASIPPLTIVSTAGIVTLAGDLKLSGDYTYTSGTVSAGTSTLHFSRPSSAYAIVPGSAVYNNVIFEGVSSGAVATMTGTMIVNGVLTFASSTTAGSVNGGGFAAAGNVVFSSAGVTGTSALSFTGAGARSLSIAGTASILTGSITVNKTTDAVLTLASATAFNSGGQTLAITSGILDMAGYSLTINSNLSVALAGSLYCSGGVLSQGSLTNNGVIDCPNIGFSWTGTGGDSNWTTAANWSGGVVPGASNIAVFGTQCSGAFCNATIDASMSTTGIFLRSLYSATVTQGSGNTITLAAYGMKQAAGTFAGGNFNITNTGPFILSGGSFTSTSAIFYQGSDWTILNSPTFNHNSGTLNFNGSATLKSGAVRYNHLTIYGYYGISMNLAGSTMYVDGNLVMGTGTNYACTINSGTIVAAGSLVGDGGSYQGCGGSIVVQIAGRAGGQTISGGIPSVTIAAGTNAVTLSGAVTINGSYTVTSAGSLTSTGSTLTLNTSGVLTPGTFHYNHVTIFGYYGININLAGSTMYVDGNLAMGTGSGYPCTVNSGTIVAAGASVGDGGSYQGCGGSVLVQVAGNAGGQTISGGLPSTTIVAGSNNVTLAGAVTINGSYTVTSAGSLTTTGSTLLLYTGGVLTPGTFHYNHVTIYGYYGININLAGSTMYVDGNLVMGTGSGYPCTINSGIIVAAGASVGDGGSYMGCGGSVVVQIAGNAGGQTISGSLPSTTIVAGTNNVTLAGSVTINGNYTYTSSGTFTSTGSTLYLASSTTNTMGLVHYNNLNMYGSYGTAISFANSIVYVDGSISMGTGNGTACTIDSGTLMVVGNINSNTFYDGCSGTAVFQFVGTTNQTINLTANGRFPSGNIYINNAAGVTLASRVDWNSASQATTVTTGALSMGGSAGSGGNNLTLTSLSLNGNTVTRNAGVLTVGGSVVGPGTQSIYGGTVAP